MDFTLDDVRRALDVPLPDPGEAPKHAAVAALLLPGLDLLFIRRAEAPGDPWSGHVAFPGGRLNPGEAPLDAAIRETREEIGVDLREATYLGALPALQPISGMGLIVHPFVWAFEREPVYQPNYEVASVHRFGLGPLVQGVGRGPFDFRWGDRELVLPRVDFDGVRLWGMTLRVVDDLLHRLDGRGQGLERPRIDP